MPTKTSPNGSFRFEREFDGLEITSASGVFGDWSSKKVRDEYNYRDGLLTKLHDRSQGDILKALKAGTLTIQDLVLADKSGKLGGLVSDLLTQKPLWKTWEEAIPTMRTKRSKRPLNERTKDLYVTVLNRVKALGVLGEDATIADIALVDWSIPLDDWDQSAASWNHMGRGLGRFLRSYLQDRYHPLWRQFVNDFPMMEEVPRKPQLPVKALRRIFDMVAPVKYVHAFVVLALTGLRLGELCALRAEDIDDESFSLRVWRGKTRKSIRTIYVAPQHWHHVQASLPLQVTHWYLREVWRAAVDRAFPYKVNGKVVGQKKDLRIHDLRHFTAQQLTNKKVTLMDIRQNHGHSDIRTTQDYADQEARQTCALVMGEVMEEFVGIGAE